MKRWLKTQMLLKNGVWCIWCLVFEIYALSGVSTLALRYQLLDIFENGILLLLLELGAKIAARPFSTGCGTVFFFFSLENAGSEQNSLAKNLIIIVNSPSTVKEKTKSNIREE